MSPVFRFLIPVSRLSFRFSFFISNFPFPIFPIPISNFVTPTRTPASTLHSSFPYPLHTPLTYIPFLSSPLLSTPYPHKERIQPFPVTSHPKNPHTDPKTQHFNHGTQRTPLQQACKTGNLPIVKLLMETHACNDALIAPDGQLALRLASRNGHKDIVSYLPLRRGGGWKRWKHNHKQSMFIAK